EQFTGADGITQPYTSARLKTQSLFAQAYGRFEARIKIPRGQGIWPAFWMMGDDVARVDWPDCGEIDIMENIGREPGMVYGSLHAPSYIAGTSDMSKGTPLPNSQNYANDFHVTPSSGNPASSASTWTPTISRLSLKPNGPKAAAGFSTIRSSSSSTWPSVATG